MAKLSVYILAYNEAAKIEDALKSVVWADEIIVVDSGSTDGTVELVRRYNARVIQVPFTGFGRLRNSAIEACTNEWILSLDADERCTTHARDEILACIHDPQSADAYFIPRNNFFMGRRIRFSGWYPDFRQPQLFRKGALVYKAEDMVHEGFILKGTAAYLKHALWQFPFQNFSQIICKMDRYSDLGVDKLIRRGVTASMTKALLHSLGNFLRIYVLKLGFLDGWAGFVIALSNFEGTFYKYAKFAEKMFHWDQPPMRED